MEDQYLKLYNKMVMAVILQTFASLPPSISQLETLFICAKHLYYCIYFQLKVISHDCDTLHCAISTVIQLFMSYHVKDEISIPQLLVSTESSLILGCQETLL